MLEEIQSYFTDVRRALEKAEDAVHQGMKHSARDVLLREELDAKRDENRRLDESNRVLHIDLEKKDIKIEQSRLDSKILEERVERLEAKLKRANKSGSPENRRARSPPTSQPKIATKAKGSSPGPGLNNSSPTREEQSASRSSSRERSRSPVVRRIPAQAESIATAPKATSPAAPAVARKAPVGANGRAAPKAGSQTICFLYIIGRCEKGDKCASKHPREEDCKQIRDRMQKTKCRYAVECKRKDCVFSHPPERDNNTLV